MKMTVMKTPLGLLAGCIVAFGSYAAPVALNDAQLDAVAAGGQDTVSGFVCTVNVHYAGLATAANKAQTEAVNFGGPITGVDVNGDTTTYYTVAPHGAGDLTIPLNATNTGTPSAGFSAPGDKTYSAIWAR